MSTSPVETIPLLENLQDNTFPDVIGPPNSPAKEAAVSFVTPNRFSELEDESEVTTPTGGSSALPNSSSAPEGNENVPGHTFINVDPPLDNEDPPLPPILRLGRRASYSNVNTNAQFVHRASYPGESDEYSSTSSDEFSDLDSQQAAYHQASLADSIQQIHLRSRRARSPSAPPKARFSDSESERYPAEATTGTGVRKGLPRELPTGTSTHKFKTSIDMRGAFEQFKVKKEAEIRKNQRKNESRRERAKYLPGHSDVEPYKKKPNNRHRKAGRQSSSSGSGSDTTDTRRRKRRARKGKGKAPPSPPSSSNSSEESDSSDSSSSSTGRRFRKNRSKNNRS
ncbi:hypothetical protein P7C70_g9487, partial [Phenoliferia sp. Uapishka_3]